MKKLADMAKKVLTEGNKISGKMVNVQSDLYGDTGDLIIQIKDNIIDDVMIKKIQQEFNTERYKIYPYIKNSLIVPNLEIDLETEVFDIVYKLYKKYIEN